MFCKYCGKEVDEDSNYCSHCGKYLRSINPYYQVEKDTKDLMNKAYEKLSPIIPLDDKFILENNKIELEEIISQYSQAIELRNTYPSAYLYRSIARFLNGDFVGSDLDILRSLSMNPYYKTALKWKKIFELKRDPNTAEYNSLRYGLVNKNDDIIDLPFGSEEEGNEGKRIFKRLKSAMDDELPPF